MAKLNAAQRKKLPKSDFGLPSKVGRGKGAENKAGKGAYPMPDKEHAAKAKAYASKEEHAGKLSKAQEAKIDRKANKKLYGSSKAPKGRK